MKKFWTIIFVLSVYLRPLMSQVMQNHHIQHFSKLGGLTGLEVGFQKLMHEFLQICGADPATCLIFGYTAIGLYLTACLFIVIEGFWHLLLKTKLDIHQELTSNTTTNDKKQSLK